jgi:hypothetical protein
MDARDVIEALGGAAALARKLDMLPIESGSASVRGWYARRSIPAQWFSAVTRVAQEAGLGDITLDTLSMLAQDRRLRRATSRHKASDRTPLRGTVISETSAA